MGQLRNAVIGGDDGVEGQQAVVVGAAQKRAAHQRRTIGRQAGNDKVGTSWGVVGRAEAEGRRGRAPAESGLQRPAGGGVVGRARRAQYQQLALIIHHQAMRKIGPAATHIGGPHPRRRPAHAGVVLDDGNVNQPREGGLKRAWAGWVAGLEGNAARVEVALRVVGRREAPVVGHRARVGGKYHHRVDGQRPRGIILAQGKPHHPPGQHVAAGHGLALTGGRGLPGQRGALGDGAHAGFHQQVAAGVQRQGLGPVVPQANGGRPGPGGQLKIVFEVLVSAFVHSRIHAGPQAGVAQLAVAAHVAGPVPGVGPKEIAAVLSSGCFGAERRSRAGSLKMQS